MDQNFSADDIARMRAILATHDAQNNPMGMVKEFDLNNPPKVHVPYMEYPKIVYHHERRDHRRVTSKAEELSAREAGYTDVPYPREAPAEPELDAADQAEIAKLEAKLKAARAAKAKLGK